MNREFDVTLTTSFQDLYTLMLTVTGAVPTDGILPDRCQMLGVILDPGNTNTVTYADRNNANNTGYIVTSTLQFGPFPSNVICLRDHFFKGGASGQKIKVIPSYT